MKPFLCIDLTVDKKNEQFNGADFLVQEPSAALSQSLAVSAGKASETIERAKLPLLFRIVQYICGITALLIAGGIFKADVSLAEGYQNAAWLYWTAGICAVVWLILWSWSKLKAKTILETDESAQTFSHLEGTTKAVYQELGVPDDAKDIDILSFLYKVKDGNIKITEKGMQMAPYLNPAFKIFTDTENLYLANLEGKYAFPLSAITSVQTVKKHIRIAGWNKEEAFNKGTYKQYKLTRDNYGCIHCKQYHVVEINYQNETYGIYIPCYELPTFEESIK